MRKLTNKKSIKVSPRKLAKIIAECACQEMSGGSSTSSGGDVKLPSAPRDSSSPSQDSVDAGLFPGMGDSPALSDGGGGNGGCGDSDVKRPEAGSMSAPSKPTDNEEPVKNVVPDVADDADDSDSVELVIGSI